MQTTTHKRRTNGKGGGSFTAKEWRWLCNRFDMRCVACGEERQLVADHVIPASKGGSSAIENIQPLCVPCNQAKNTTARDFRDMPFVQWAPKPEIQSPRMLTIQFRLQSSEKARVQALADAAGLTVSDFIRLKVGL